MSVEKVKELQIFVDDFNKKLKDSCILYEQNQEKLNLKKLKKCYSQVNQIGKTKKEKLVILPYIYKEDDKKSIKKTPSDFNIFNKRPAWKPPKGVPDFFEEYKRLQSQHDLDNWEKVCKYYKLILIYRKE